MLSLCLSLHAAGSRKLTHIESEPITILTEGGMLNTHAKAKIVYGPAWSFHDFGRIQVEARSLIDFIFVSAPITADKCRVIGDKPDNGYLSDHAPILTSLTVN